MRTAQRISQEYPGIEIKDFFDLVAEEAELIAEVTRQGKMSRHQSDDKFLACALAGKVPLIITGDKHLLELNPFQLIEIISPGTLARRLIN